MIYNPSRDVDILNLNLHTRNTTSHTLRELNHQPWWHVAASIIGIALLAVALNTTMKPVAPLLSPVGNNQPLKKTNGYEVFGFAPYWNFDKLENVDFHVLTTLAYFDVPLLANGDLNTNSVGYQTFISDKANQLFDKAHEDNTNVVLTVTLMDNNSISRILDNPQAQANAVYQIVNEVQSARLDGINVDIEYGGAATDDQRHKFTAFVQNLTEAMHQANPNSKVSVSVYASSARAQNLYDINNLAKVTDGIFMMAYDFATMSSNKAVPTSPLYGYKEGKYWYDVSTAVEDFLSQMPAEKLILGVPWYGYDYPVYNPEANSDTYKGYSYKYKVRAKKKWIIKTSRVQIPSLVQTYHSAQEQIRSDAPGITDYREGWDQEAQVGWKAYKQNGTWRIVFIEDPRSLEQKYSFVKEKQLAGVGMWALGFDNGQDMWQLLEQQFGTHGAQVARK